MGNRELNHMRNREFSQIGNWEPVQIGNLEFGQIYGPCRNILYIWTCFLLLVHRHNLDQNSWHRFGIGDVTYWKNRSGSQIIYLQGAFFGILISTSGAEL